MVSLSRCTGFHNQNAAAPDCLFVSIKGLPVLWTLPLFIIAIFTCAPNSIVHCKNYRAGRHRGKDRLLAQEVLGLIFGPVKLDTVSPMAYHHCNDSLKLCCLAISRGDRPRLLLLAST